jgi:ABC-type transport system involved in multi-copper enzyme maturation permease subunit
MSTTSIADRPLSPPVPSTGGNPFLGLVRSEIIKIRTTNVWWLLGLGALATTALALLVDCLTADDNLTHAAAADRHSQLIQSGQSVFTAGQFFGLMFIMLLGILIVTNEFHHQTATATFLTTPHRTTVILGKFAAALIGAVVLAVITMAIDAVVGTLVFHSIGYGNPLGNADVLQAMALNLLVYVAWAIMGVGFGVLIRSQVGATVTATVLYLPGQYLSLIAIAALHYLIKKAWVYKAAILLPAVASNQLVTGNMNIDTTPLPGRWVALAVLLVWGVGAGTIGTLITRKRDIS